MPAVRSRERRHDSNHETIGIVRSGEDEEKDRTEAADSASANEKDIWRRRTGVRRRDRRRREPPKDSISRTSSSRQTGRIGRNFSESSRGSRVSRLRKIDIVTGEEKPSLFPTPSSA